MLTGIPEWLEIAAGMTNELGWAKLSFLMGDPNFALIKQYEAAGLNDPDPAWDVPAPRVTRQRAALDWLMMANEAVWLVHPETTLGFKDALHVKQQPDGEWAIRAVLHPPPLQSRRPRGPGLTVQRLEEARALNVRLAALKRQGPLWYALRSLWGALTEVWFHNRYMLTWIALEALFGPRDPGEVRYRLSQHLAFFLANTPEERRSLFDLAKGDYVKRSYIAHGEGERVKQTEWETLMIRAEEWMRAAAVRILTSETLLDRFATSERRDTFFDDLVLGVGLGTPEGACGS